MAHSDLIHAKLALSYWLLLSGSLMPMRHVLDIFSMVAIVVCAVANPAVAILALGKGAWVGALLFAALTVCNWAVILYTIQLNHRAV